MPSSVRAAAVNDWAAHKSAGWKLVSVGTWRDLEYSRVRRVDGTCRSGSWSLESWSRGDVQPYRIGVCVAAMESTQARRHAHVVIVYVGRALDLSAAQLMAHKTARQSAQCVGKLGSVPGLFWH